MEMTRDCNCAILRLSGMGSGSPSLESKFSTLQAASSELLMMCGRNRGFDPSNHFHPHPSTAPTLPHQPAPSSPRRCAAPRGSRLEIDGAWRSPGKRHRHLSGARSGGWADQRGAPKIGGCGRRIGGCGRCAVPGVKHVRLRRGSPKVVVWRSAS